MTVAECPDITQKIEHEVKRRHDLLPAKYQEKRTVPVSVKTRIGYDEPVIEEWIPTLLEMEPTTIAIHGRTLKQQYGGSASWENIGKAAAIIKKTETIALGNGDVQTHAMALDYVSTYGVDGVLLGRASLGNPYVFLPESPAGPNIFQIAVEHSELFEQIYKDEEKYSFMPMRKHLAWYVKAIPNATDIRIQLVQATNAAQVREIFQKYQLI
jgi:tRNA-dihydrouridine synthase